MRLARIASLSLLCGAVLAGCGAGKPPAKSVESSPAPSSPPAGSAGAPAGGAPRPSREVSPGVVRASSQGLSATMHAGGHHPRVGKRWPVSFTVTQAGRPARARVRYEYLFAGQVVARRSNYGFSGAFHDTFLWPSSAVGYPLTFRAVITASKTTLDLDYSVQVIR